MKRKSTITAKEVQMISFESKKRLLEKKLERIWSKVYNKRGELLKGGSTGFVKLSKICCELAIVNSKIKK